ncbi:MAG: hypothetical protein A2048_04520 [Deltaproteobacteria bacterium GWA2_45_12]|nr:MAG: hypothetical protein A2048_04520 [Deltaproteobacteria bacterium GWA2_45_12]
MDEDRKIGSIETEIRNHRNFHLRIGGAPPEAPGVIHIHHGNGNIIGADDSYYVPGCQGAEAAGGQVAGNLERGVITNALLCEVNVRKVLRFEELGAEYINEQTGRCLEEQGLSPELDLDVITSPGVTPDSNRDDRERRAVDFAINRLATDPWPEVTECIRQSVELFYQAPLRNLYMSEGYDYENPDTDGDGVCDLQDTCVQLPNFDDYPDVESDEGPDPFDNDGLGYSCDNCPRHPNPKNEQGIQPESDGDGIGDACDICPGDHAMPFNVEDPLRDFDLDHVNDQCDNCPEIANPLPIRVGENRQLDQDEDGLGDVCDQFPYDRNNDCDGDGVPGRVAANSGERVDLFPFDLNSIEQDSDGDGIQACSLDTSCPIADVRCDNCPTHNNPSQSNTDKDLPSGDPQGDACDDDDDGDALIDDLDNCPWHFNDNQDDTDGDGSGDACDPPDSDHDNIIDEADNCPHDFNEAQTDRDQDEKGDICDRCPDLNSATQDYDQDCVADSDDNCPQTKNGRLESNDQGDLDGDGVGDVCDSCVRNANAGPQQNLDTDGDGVKDTCDNCPSLPNADQRNSDGILTGDACEIIVLSLTGTTLYIDWDDLNEQRRSVQAFFVANPIGNARLGNVRCFIKDSNNQHISECTRVEMGINNQNLPIGNLTWNGRKEDGSVAIPGIYKMELQGQTSDGRDISPPAPVMFTIHRIQFFKMAQGLAQSGGNGANNNLPPIEKLVLYVNNDDDDRDFLEDLADNETQNDNDIVPLTIRMDPPLRGELTVRIVGDNPEDPQPPVSLWLNPSHSNALARPYVIETGENPTSVIYIEGGKGGKQQLQVEWNSREAGGQGLALSEKRLPLSIIQIDVVKDKNNNQRTECAPNQPDNCGIGIVDKTNNPVDYLQIARWERGFYKEVVRDDQGIETGILQIYNEGDPSRNFIDRDSERFYIRMINPEANLNSHAIDIIQSTNPFSLSLGTVRQSASFDDLTPITLTETGPNTDIFVSKSQILTTATMGMTLDNDSNAEDLMTCHISHRCSDDQFNAHDGLVGPVVDDAPEDRTHMTLIDGSVRVRFQASEQIGAIEKEISICQREPDQRKMVQMRIFVFKESFLDTGIRLPDGNIVGAGNGRFDYEDRDQNGICNDSNGWECEPFADINTKNENNKNEIFYLDNLTIDMFLPSGVRNPIIDSSLGSSIRITNILWQQGCVAILPESIQIIEPPRNPGSEVDIFYEPGTVNIEDITLARIIREFRGQLLVEGLNVFVVPGLMIRADGQLMAGAYFGPDTMSEFGLPGFEGGIIFVDNYYTVMSGVIAHEIGHAFDNLAHEGYPPISSENSIFEKIYFYPYGKMEDLFLITSNRRLSSLAISSAHVQRSPGAFQTPGNRILVQFDPNIDIEDTIQNFINNLAENPAVNIQEPPTPP